MHITGASTIVVHWFGVLVMILAFNNDHGSYTIYSYEITAKALYLNIGLVLTSIAFLLQLHINREFYFEYVQRIYTQETPNEFYMRLFALEPVVYLEFSAMKVKYTPLAWNNSLNMSTYTLDSSTVFVRLHLKGHILFTPEARQYLDAERHTESSFVNEYHRLNDSIKTQYLFSNTSLCNCTTLNFGFYALMALAGLVPLYKAACEHNTRTFNLEFSKQIVSF